MYSALRSEHCLQVKPTLRCLPSPQARWRRLRSGTLSPKPTLLSHLIKNTTSNQVLLTGNRRTCSHRISISKTVSCNAIFFPVVVFSCQCLGTHFVTLYIQDNKLRSHPRNATYPALRDTNPRNSTPQRPRTFSGSACKSSFISLRGQILLIGRFLPSLPIVDVSIQRSGFQGKKFK